MVHYTIRCDPLPGKEEEFDRFLTEKMRGFWVGQAGVRGYHVYGDKLLGYPERTIVIEMEDLGSLQRILDSDQRKRLRKEFLCYTARVESQIQDVIV